MKSGRKWFKNEIEFIVRGVYRRSPYSQVEIRSVNLTKEWTQQQQKEKNAEIKKKNL